MKSAKSCLILLVLLGAFGNRAVPPSNKTLVGFLSSIGFDRSDIDAYGAVVAPMNTRRLAILPSVFNGAFATFQNGGRNTDRPLGQNLATFGDTLTCVVGKHNFKMGAGFVRNAALDGFAVNVGTQEGSMTYNGDGGVTDPFADFIVGLPPTSVSYIMLPGLGWMSTTGSRASSSRMTGKSCRD